MIYFDLIKLAIIFMSGNATYFLLCCSTTNQNKEFYKKSAKSKRRNVKY